VIASAAVTTGLFVLAGVVVGGLVTGAVNYAFEWRRERVRLRVAVRLLESELLLATGLADWRIEQGAWSPWNFERAHRSWSEYRADVVGLSADEWYAVSGGFAAIELLERRFVNKPFATMLDAGETQALEIASAAMLEGANTLRRRQGLEDVARFGGPGGEPNG
jgi:hypothetical protein